MLSSPCPSWRECGGCPWIAAGRESARGVREDGLRAALREYLGPQVAESSIAWTEQPQPDGYRRRVRLQIDDEGRIGFFNPSKYRDCAVLTPALREQLGQLLDESKEHAPALRLLRHLELREPDLDGRRGVYFAKRDPTRALDAEIRANLGQWLRDHCAAVADEVEPVPSQRLALSGSWHYVPVSSFLQINARINECLVSDLVSEVRARRLASFCDLYAGSGNFTLPLLAAGLSGWSVELDDRACAAAERAAIEQALSFWRFVNRDASQFARELAGTRQFELVVLDPPRAGVRQDLDAMARLSAHSLVYCACNVRSLARDLARLVELGWTLDRISAYDMFEHTDHLETVAWLHR